MFTSGLLTFCYLLGRLQRIVDIDIDFSLILVLVLRHTTTGIFGILFQKIEYCLCQSKSVVQRDNIDSIDLTMAEMQHSVSLSLTVH